MTAALAAIAALDDGLATPADRAAAAALDAEASAYWHRVNLQVDAWQADRCVICGQNGEGAECDTCTAGWDAEIVRGADL